MLVFTCSALSRSAQEEEEEGPSLPPRTFRPNSQVTGVGSWPDMVMPAVGLVMEEFFPIEYPQWLLSL